MSNVVLNHRLRRLQGMVETQRNCLDGGDYMLGMYNGMVFSHNLISDEWTIPYVDSYTPLRPRVRHKSKHRNKD